MKKQIDWVDLGQGESHSSLFIHRGENCQNYHYHKRYNGALRYARFLSIVLAYAARIEKAQEVK